MTTVPTLSDGTVTLRAHSVADIDGVLDQGRDPLSQRWTTVPVPYHRGHAESFVGEVMPGGWDAGSEWGFAVEAEGRYGGTVSLRDEGTGRVEVAYGSAPWIRGRGHMERGLRLLLEWGFKEKRVHTVVWRAHRGNWASRRVAWRLGFSVDGMLRRYLAHHGTLVDAWVGTLLREEPMAPRSPWLVTPVIEADGLRLRPLREDDVDRVVEACSDATTQHWLGRMPSAYGREDALDWIEGTRDTAAEGRAVSWAIADPDDDRLLGAINLFDHLPGVQVEVGYWVHPEVRGRGVMTRAVGLALRHAFLDLEVARVRATAAVDNTASRRVLEANGLVDRGIERLATVLRTGPADGVIYDVLAEEWRRA